MRLGIELIAAVLAALLTFTFTHSSHSILQPTPFSSSPRLFGRHLSRGGASPIPASSPSSSGGSKFSSGASSRSSRDVPASPLLAPPIYSPLLLRVTVPDPLSSSPSSPSASSDSVLSISPAKSAELSLPAGSFASVQGRRRRRITLRVDVDPALGKSKSTCAISQAAARYLRLADGDSLKVCQPEEATDSIEPSSSTSSSSTLSSSTRAAYTVSVSPAPKSGVTVSCVASSLSSLLSTTGVDDIPNNVLISRFLKPYFEGEGEGGDSVINPGVVYTAVEATTGHKLEFMLTLTDPVGSPPLPSSSTPLRVSSNTPITVGPPVAPPPVSLGYDSLGGLRPTLLALRSSLELPLRYPSLWSACGVPPPKALLLHGPRGCGKTLLAKCIAEETGAALIIVDGTALASKKSADAEEELKKAFDDAKKRAPAVVFIDEIEAIAPRREEGGGGGGDGPDKRISSQLMSLLDGLATSGGAGGDASRVVVLAATCRPNDIDANLRRPGRFDKELDIAIPDEKGRKEILQIKMRDMRLAKDVDVDLLARETHGFVGADLVLLCLEAGMECIRRNVASGLDVSGEDTIPERTLREMQIDMKCFEHALAVCDPSTLRENKVEIPDTKWSDIGGLEETKRELQEMVRYPIEHSGLFSKFGLPASRGVLFYGPPGCGKTLMAKAIASECGANFISVKGPELLNMWFGGSEANVRNLFDKARAASPCILFFDEIDSIARARGSGAGGGGSDTSDRVINQLLSEIDGVSSGKTLFIIGATNRPDILDPGIMRPGRLDQLVYIPLPDRASRVAIFKAALRKSPIDPKVKLEQLADVTEGFSGADITEICQRAAKNAIRDDIAAEKRNKNRKGDGVPASRVPFITKEHFEASMGKARRSVTPEIIKQYRDFAEKSKQKWTGGGGGSGVGGSGGGGGGSGVVEEQPTYDIDQEEAAQRAEEASILGEEGGGATQAQQPAAKS